MWLAAKPAPRRTRSISIAAPVFNKNGQILASVGVGSPIAEFDRDRTQDYIDLVKEAGRTATANLATLETYLDLPARGVN